MSRREVMPVDLYDEAIASVLTDIAGAGTVEEEYWAGYLRGVRRRINGADFCTAEDHLKWLNISGDDPDPVLRAKGHGYRDGFYGNDGPITCFEKNFSVKMKKSKSE